MSVPDWVAMYEAAKEGRLLTHLHSHVPPARWGEKTTMDQTLLHYACEGDDAAALAVLVKHGLDLEARTADGWTPALWAAYHGQPRALEALCAAGANLRAQTPHGYAPLDLALGSPDNGCLHVLLANGVRLASIHENNQKHIQPWMTTFEAGLLRCRAVAVIFLGIKHRRPRDWAHIDKFLVAEWARAIWSTRTAVEWRPKLRGRK